MCTHLCSTFETTVYNLQRLLKDLARENDRRDSTVQVYNIHKYTHTHTHTYIIYDNDIVCTENDFIVTWSKFYRRLFVRVYIYRL